MQGGRIYLGVREDGSVVGVDDAKALQEAILSVLQDAISLDASQYCKTYTETVDAKTIVVAEVLAAAKPHAWHCIKKPKLIWSLICFMPWVWWLVPAFIPT